MTPAQTTDARRFVPPMPADEALKLPKRERLELVKPILRQHQAEHQGLGDRDSYRDSRWSWIYKVLKERGSNYGDLGQARGEIEREDKYGHYRDRAWTTIRVIDDGWHQYEAEVHYPRPIRRSDTCRTSYQEQKFRTRRGAERWAAAKVKRYDKYLLRLIREGVYDEYGYER